MPQLTPVSGDPFAGAYDDGGSGAIAALAQKALAAGDTIRQAFTPSQTPGDPNATGPNRLMSIGASPVDKYAGQVGQQIAGLGALPHDVATGQVNPLSDEGIGRTNVLATLMVGAGGPQVGAGESVLGSGAAKPSFTAYHGSPHSFDHFDLSKIGTGEGAQAYGHGLYFAGNEGVARSYRDALSPRRPADPSAISTPAPQALANHIDETINKYPDLSRNEIEDAVRDTYPGVVPKNLRDVINATVDGHMYEARINADPEHFLDWDKPLSEQPAVASKLGLSVRPEEDIHSDALRLMEQGNKSAGRPGGWMDDPVIRSQVEGLQSELDRRAPDVTGADYYRQTSPDDFLHSTLQSGNSIPERSQALRDAGIPGIKYKDAGSRGADGGNGTHNYVVFDDKTIDILRKYGLAGVMAGGAGAAGAAAMPQVQSPLNDPNKLSQFLANGGA